MNTVPKKKKQLQLVIIVIHSQIADPHQKKKKKKKKKIKKKKKKKNILSVLIMKLKVFPYGEMTSCIYLILIYHVIVTKVKVILPKTHLSRLALAYL